MRGVLEVGGSNRTFPGGNLSNFFPHAFVFDGIWCASMEGLLQSLKFKDLDQQIEVCALVGGKAKKIGTTRNEIWQATQTLWWRGNPFDRQSSAYQELLDRLFDALATNDDFCTALHASGETDLVHSIGSSDPTLSILTEREFCDRLMKLRERLMLS